MSALDGWMNADRRNLDRTVHVLPVRDLVSHDMSRDCVCGPAVKPSLGSSIVQVVHMSLDGRELVFG